MNPEPQQTTTDAARVYSERLSARQAEAEELTVKDRALSIARFIVFVLAFAYGVFAFKSESVPWLGLALPLAAFVSLLVYHDRVIQRRRKAEGAAVFYEQGIARLENRWMGQGVAGEIFRDPEHLYAEDLDLFGKGSMFERLCLARTRPGRRTLADWLKAPAPVAEARARQDAVRELTNNLDLREDLASLAGEIRAGVKPGALRAWATEPSELDPRRFRFAAFGLAAAAVGALAAWPLLNVGPIPFAIVALAEAALSFRLKDACSQITEKVIRPGRELGLLSLVLARLEEEQFESPKLRELRSELDTQGLPPSRQIARLRRYVRLYEDSYRNQAALLFFPIAFVLMWGVQLALAMEAWRRAVGPAVPRWIDAIGELEALSSMAGYAFERPDDVFAQIEEGPGRLEGEQLGHPLIPAAACVCNDLHLSSEHQAHIISGSNMSGKSTFMRTVGLNVVLALAGAPVRAASLRLSPLQVGALIHIQDSLMEGASKFYAEITRINRIVKLAGENPPLLFLFDEIMNGTNSHDRRIGAAAVMRRVVGDGALGLVSTHDLALAEIEKDLAPKVSNVHFEDQIIDGKITFDYRMRAGVVKKSNALELMRAVGLDV